MTRRSTVNDFHTFVGTLFFGLFLVVTASARTAAAAGSSNVITLALIGGLLLAASFYILESGRRTPRTGRVAGKVVAAVPMSLLRFKSNSRAA